MSRRQHVSFLVAAMLAASLLTVAPVGAHPDGDAHHVSPLPEQASAVMRTFDDRHHVGHEHGPQLLLSAAGATCTNGEAAGYPCDSVDLEAFLPLAMLGGSSTEEANDIWGWTHAASGREFALIGMTFGTAFVEITDPQNPTYLGELQTHGSFGSTWRDVKTRGDHAFIVSEANRHGMQVFDLTQLLSVANPPVQFSETAHYNRIGNAHNIVIDEDIPLAFIVGAGGRRGCAGGLHMVDISVPTSPSFAGCFDADGYTHDAQCLVYDGPDAEHTGKDICLASNEDTVTIVDVSNPAAPVQLSRTGYPGAQYTHQGWLTEDRRHFLVDDELDESNLGHNTRTRVFDVSDLDAPSLVGFHDATTSAIDHNQYVVGDLTFQANYRAGLRILRMDDPATASFTEVGYFDVWPADDAPQFNGAWSVYPWYASGVVVVSGIEQGLYVLRPNVGGGGPTDAAPTATMTAPADGSTVSGTVAVTADASDDNGVTQVEFFAGGTSIGVDTTAPYSTSLDTTSLSDGPLTIQAVATDTIGQTGSDSIGVVVDNVADPAIHVGDLDGASAADGRGGKWSATVTVLVHDAGDAPVAGATVSGSWSTGGSASCTTDASGRCVVSTSGLKRNQASTTFTVQSATAAGSTYDASANHDPDGDSNGTSIVVTSP